MAISRTRCARGSTTSSRCVPAIGLVYPLAGLLIAQVALHAEMLPILFPLVAGFALIGPFAAVGLYDASRRRERGEPARWDGE